MIKWHLCSLLLALLPNKGFVDVRNDTYKDREHVSTTSSSVFLNRSK